MGTSGGGPAWRARRQQLQRFLRAHHSIVGSDELTHQLEFSTSAVGRLVGDHTLVKYGRRRGVYASAGAAIGPLGHLRAHLLWHGPGAALTGQAAGYALGHLVYLPRSITTARPRVPPAAVSRGQLVGFLETDVVVRHGLRTANATATSLRLAALAASKHATETDRRALRRLLRGAASNDPTLVPRLRELVDGPSFTGRAILKAEILGGLERTKIIRSTLEDAFVEFCKRHGIPVPETNAVVYGLELDAFWRQFNRYAEVNTYGTHGDEISFERDQQRRSKLAGLGIHGIGVTDRRMEFEPHELAADLKGFLGIG